MSSQAMTPITSRSWHHISPFDRIAWSNLPCSCSISCCLLTNAYRAIYAVQFDENIWVLHAFQKKSKTGIKTPKQDIDLVKERLKRLKEMLK